MKKLLALLSLLITLNCFGYDFGDTIESVKKEFGDSCIVTINNIQIISELYGIELTIDFTFKDNRLVKIFGYSQKMIEDSALIKGIKLQMFGAQAKLNGELVDYITTKTSDDEVLIEWIYEDGKVEWVLKKVDDRFIITFEHKK
jgi:hypothetical protein